MPHSTPPHKNGEYDDCGEPESIVKPPAAYAQCTDSKVGQSHFLLKRIAFWPADVFGDDVRFEKVSEGKSECLRSDPVDEQVGEDDVCPVAGALLNESADGKGDYKLQRKINTVVCK